MANPFKTLAKNTIQWALTGGTKEHKKPAHDLVPFTMLSSVVQGIALGDNNAAEGLKQYVMWPYACVSKISQELSAMQIRLFKTKPNGDIEEVKIHPALDLLDRVNPFQTHLDLQELTAINLELAGNSYWWVLKNQKGVPIEIYPWLSPANMTPIASKNNFLKGYMYQVPGESKSMFFEVDEIVHFKYPDPLNPYIGQGVIQSVRLAIDTDKKAAEFNNRFFENQARPEGVLSFDDGLNIEGVKRVREEWNKAHGRGNEHRIAILGKGKFTPSTLSQKDMDFLEQRRFGRDEILAMFKVPKFMLGMLEDVNRASAEAARLFFLSEVIRPKMMKVVSTMNEFLLPLFGDETLSYDFVNPVLEDRELILKTYESGSKFGWLTINEIRDRESLPPIDGGDTSYIPLNLLPLGVTLGDDDGDGDNKAMPNITYIKGGKLDVKKYGRTKRYIPNVRFKTRTHTDIMREVVENKIKESQLLKRQLIGKKDENIVPKDRWAEFADGLWRSKITRTDAEERAFVIKINIEFRRQEKQVLDSLKQKDINTTFDVKKESKIFIDIFEPLLLEVTKEWGEEAFNLLGLRGFETTKFVRDITKSHTKQFAGDVNDTTKLKIAKQIAEAQDAGEAIPEVRNRIMGVFKEATTSRAAKIARTEISFSSNFGNLEGFKQSGVVKGKQWWAVLDGRQDSLCEGLHQKKIFNLNSKYTGDSSFGLVTAPPAHVNCRCILLPLTSTREDQINELKKSKKDLVSEIKKQSDFSEYQKSKATSQSDEIDIKIDDLEQELKNQANNNT